MDAQARKKALFRAKLNAQKKEKRINSPLVRYNEYDQPVCRVCDVVLKSDAQWDAHQASRKHHEAISNIKASAAGNTRISNAKPAPGIESSGAEHHSEKQSAEPESSTNLSKARPSSVLPANFFDNQETKKPKTVADSVKSVDPDSNKNSGASAKTQAIESSYLENERNELPIGNAIHGKKVQPAKEVPEKSMQNAGKEANQVKGALPEGFFDNKEADLLARGIKPVKPDVKDEYKEFEKLIQEDLKEVDDRLEEEEIDAAEMIEEYESLEQRVYREKVENLRKKKMELEVARLTKRGTRSEVAKKESKNEESSSDDDSEENFAVDWRAQHL
ncbi:zinc finger protein [Melia azedarach]|uniref:Zinc finger protein n=2 Tax=Melia azedarach TaxID=155640 RepID=A0ACC1Y478_MELAZ|nr:zinc finger protein [Melia azedarach]KAJ4718536.1 zinc finger protein [Melia azedarach]